MQVEQRLLGSLTGGQGSRPRDDAAATVLNGKSLPISSVGEMKESQMGGALRGSREEKIHSPRGLQEHIPTVHLVGQKRGASMQGLASRLPGDRASLAKTRPDAIRCTGSDLSGQLLRLRQAGGDRGPAARECQDSFRMLCRGDTNHGLVVGLAR